MNRRFFLRSTLGATLAATAGTTAFAYGFDTHNLDISRVPVALGLNRPWRAVALGDIHFDPICDEAYILKVVAAVNALQPDLVLFTGDFITHNNARIEQLAWLLALTRSRLGSFAALGNHDHWSGGWFVTATLERHGIRVLTNQSYALPGEDQVYLTGLDSFWAGTPILSTFASTPSDSRHILLLHEPDPFLQLTDPRIRLQISGHTHGGQVRFPCVGALILPEWGRRFQAGLYGSDKRLLYVNRGIGTLVPHVRLACPPELTVFELT